MRMKDRTFPRNLGVWLISLFLFGLFAGCSSSNSVTNPVQSLSVSPSTSNLTVGQTVDAVLTAKFADNSTENATALATWSSVDPAVATVSNSGATKGKITAVAVGSTLIKATFQGKTAQVAVTVAPGLTRIELSPASTTLAAGTQKAITATAIFSNNTTSDVTEAATWSSNDQNVATVSNAAGSKGTTSAQALGTATITAVYQGKTGSSTVNVTAAVATALAITPQDASTPLNREKQFTATATFSDDSTQDVTASVTWASSATAVATISNDSNSAGLATPASQGTTTISAAFQSLSDDATLTVGPALTVSQLVISPSAASIPDGTERQFTAEATYSDSSVEDVTAEVTWTSLDETIATISNDAGAKGVALGVSPGGPIDIKATLGGVTDVATLTVTGAVLKSVSVEPVNAEAPVGAAQQFTATGLYSDDSTTDLTDSVVWSSSNATIASISNGAGSEGLAAANAVGSVTITADAGDISGATTFTVTDAVLQALQLDPPNEQLPLGFELQFTANGLYSDGSNRDVTDDVTWTSTDPTVASISNAAGSKGLATADDVNDGVVQVQATLGGKLASTTLTVTTATLDTIEVTPADDDLPVGSEQQYQATGSFSDASTLDLTDQVTWASSSTPKATVNQAGLVTAVAVGDGAPTQISAEHVASGISGNTDVTITDATVVSMTISPQSDSIAKGRTRSFKANAVYSDGSTGEVTSEVTWLSSNNAVATISNAAGSEGQATGVGVGTVELTASITNSELVDVEASATLTVTNAVVDVLNVTPATVSVAKGTQQQFTATAQYSDGTTPDVTADATWSSSAESVATISNAAGKEGLASTVAAGTATITAQFGGKTDTSALTVTAAQIVSIEIEPLDPAMPKGTSRNFTATATFTDATTQDVTTQVTWATADPTIADVSNASGTKGRVTATGDAAETADITATLDGITGTSNVTVTDAQLQSIVVTPANASIEVGQSQQYMAEGIFSDASKQDITASVTWTTSNPSVATITPNAGLATGVSAGSVSVFARDPGGVVEGSTTLTVTNPAP